MAVRLRTRITLVLGLSMGLIAATLVAVLYRQVSGVRFDEIRDQVQLVAERAARRVDGDAHARLTDPDFLAAKPRAAELAEQADYKSVLDALWQTYRESRSRRAHIVNIYTMAPDPAGGWLYAVEADVDSDLDVYDPGDHYEEGTCPAEVLERPTADTEFVTDEDGTWLTGYAPILDRQGEAVGFVGVDLARQDVLGRLAPLAQWFVLLGLAGLAAAWGSGWLISRWIARPIEALHCGVREIERGNLEHRVCANGADEIEVLAGAFNRMVDAIRERERIRETLRRHVSGPIADKVLAHENGRGLLEGERRRVTVLFCDVRGFTTFAETNPPAEVLRTLNRYFATIAACISQHEGMLDKFIGDNVMAVFGAPVPQGDDPARAVACALKIREAVTRLNRERQLAGEPPLGVGIGIHSGVAMAGEVGTDERSEYTVIGHHVNMAKRVEEIARAGQVLATEAVWQEVEDLFDADGSGVLETQAGTKLPLYAIRGPRTPRRGSQPKRKKRPSTRRFLKVPPSRN